MYNKTLTPYHQLFDHAPMAAAILDVDNLKLQMANRQMHRLWDKDASVTGMPLLDFLPELVGQRFPAYLEEVAKTGKTIEERSARVMLIRAGKPEWLFTDYSYSPIFSRQFSPIGILVLATDVSERELHRLAAQQSSRDLRALVMSAPVPMCIYKGAQLTIEVANPQMQDLWQGRPRVPDHILNYVLQFRIPYTCSERGITYSYTPIGSKECGDTGVCVVATVN